MVITGKEDFDKTLNKCITLEWKEYISVLKYTLWPLECTKHKAVQYKYILLDLTFIILVLLINNKKD